MSLTEFRILELWDETMVDTGIYSLLGRLAEIQHETIGKFTALTHSESKSYIFIMHHDSDMAYYLLNNPNEIKKIDLDEFLEGKVNMRGQVFISYSHRDYLIEESANKGEYFYYEKRVDQFNSNNKFEINLRKNRDQITGKPKDIDCSFAELDSFFKAAISFFSSKIKTSSNLRSKSKGMMSLEVTFQKNPPDFILTKLSTFGFSIDEILEVLKQMRNQIFR